MVDMKAFLSIRRWQCHCGHCWRPNDYLHRGWLDPADSGNASESNGDDGHKHHQPVVMPMIGLGISIWSRIAAAVGLGPAKRSGFSSGFSSGFGS